MRGEKEEINCEQMLSYYKDDFSGYTHQKSVILWQSFDRDNLIGFLLDVRKPEWWSPEESCSYSDTVVLCSTGLLPSSPLSAVLLNAILSYAKEVYFGNGERSLSGKGTSMET